MCGVLKLLFMYVKQTNVLFLFLCFVTIKNQWLSSMYLETHLWNVNNFNFYSSAWPHRFNGVVITSLITTQGGWKSEWHVLRWYLLIYVSFLKLCQIQLFFPILSRIFTTWYLLSCLNYGYLLAAIFLFKFISTVW